MADTSFLDWPFFEDRHRRMAEGLDTCVQHLHVEADTDHACIELVKQLAQAGWLDYAVPDGGRFDVRSLCLIRESLARHEGLADFAFALQGLGSAPITLFGSEHLRSEYLPKAGQGQSIAAFALSEPKAGSDVAAISTTAKKYSNGYLLNGTKTWISNGGIADFYVVFARTAEAPGAKGLSAFVVDANAPGLTIQERIEVMAPHPLATLVFQDCEVPDKNLIGELGQGFKIAMSTLDIFRPSVGAAALGFARCALDEALKHATERQIFGAPLADMQMTQSKLAQMATAIDASALLIYRAAWLKDQGAPRITKEAAMAKLHATEEAQKVIDMALQLHGALGVKSGVPVERLYREIRALRIYEGASEVQEQIIARHVLAQYQERRSNGGSTTN